eukprot:gene2257-2569_t
MLCLPLLFVVLLCADFFVAGSQHRLVCCRGCHQVVEEELALVATKVAASHNGRHRGDRRLYERCGPNVKTKAKYLHVARMWFHYCLVAGIVFARWRHAALSAQDWSRVAMHMHSYSGRAFGLSDRSLESYMRMLSNMLVTRDRLDREDERWSCHPILSFGWCCFVWQGGLLVSVDLTCLRTKFRRNPRQELDGDGNLVDRPLLPGKLTQGAAVDTCPVAAFLVWAVVCGVFGWAPLVRDSSNLFAVCSDPGVCREGVTAAGVDALVASIFALRPSAVLPAAYDVPLFDGSLLSPTGDQVHTDRCSNIVHVVGVRLGLDPRRCSGISARKTMATAIVCHPQTTPFDTHRFLGHVDPRTTHVHYADPRAANNDSSAILHRQQ